MIYNKIEDALLQQKMMFDEMVEEKEIKPIVDALLVKDADYIRALAVCLEENIEILWAHLSPEGKGRLAATINNFIDLLAESEDMSYLYEVYNGNPLSSLFGQLEVV